MINIPSLQQKYKEYFSIGSAVSTNTIKLHDSLLKNHFNSITAENEMKFEHLQPKDNQFTFENADRLVTFAKENGMQMRGHALVWHNQTPDWVFENTSRSELLSRMKNHIFTVVDRYKGDIGSWDVVNEAIADECGKLLRASKWLEIIGEDFIEKAFEYAHEADSTAKLFYNDYNESHPEKREKIYMLVKSLVDRDIPIHGIGLQGHWNLADPNKDDIRMAIENYASLGLDLHITELDMSVFGWNDRRSNLTTPSEEMLEHQAKRYEEIFALLREYHQSITNVTFWGTADDYTWLDDFPVKGRKNWPFLFDENHQPKSSFHKVINF
ncbi:endo-1,4-beta-xylanase [Lederbergia lenta]|uniref:Beta-xylanase n=2 Tax=Lederbergia lenta TaxID=1467 RepID=A0A2X4W4T4_LEDLE|nr:endo-1,4-beta-xylanase [Lederbergia lenta]MCM3110921.1 endo-1,4-beta-xylanase [Lederbergia lenta]MEC2325683.1 endo-1,4-beta-xylanase [Lederbergia lenta]SQI53962.1 endo-1,4-beta-xylanase [Lederbergia lenta]